LELGPGREPLLARLPGMQNNNKIVIDLPKVADHCVSMGYTCFGQDIERERWKLDDASVDAIVTNQCLEHIANTDHSISEAHRVLKPDGIFIVSVPNQGGLMNVIFLALTINQPMNFVSDKFYGLGNPFSLSRYK